MARSSDAKRPDLTTAFVLAVGLVIALGARIYRIGEFGLWQDEVFSLRTVRMPWGDMFASIIADVVHPPLFYILLKFWTAVGGESLVWLRCLPLIFAFATIGALYLLCRELNVSVREYALAILLIALNSYLIYYSQELRMYSILTFWSVLSMWQFVRFLRDDSSPWRFVSVLFVINLLLVYTHYFGLLTIGAELGAVLLFGRQKLMPFIAQAAAVAACIAPWLWLVGGAVAAKGVGSNVGWIGRPGSGAVPQLLAEFQGEASFAHATTIGLLIFLPPIGLWLCQIWKNRDRETSITAALLGLAAGLPIVITFLLSSLSTTSAWVDRYMITAAIPYLLLAAISASRLRNVMWRYIFLSLLTAWSLGVGGWNLMYRHDRVDWLGFAATIERTPGPVYVLEPWAEMPLNEALRSRNVTITTVPDIDHVSAPEFWLAYRASTWKNESSPHALLEMRGCAVDDGTTQTMVQDQVQLFHVRCTHP